MNDLVAHLLGASSVAAWYGEPRHARRLRQRVPSVWLTELSLQDAIARSVRGQVDWLEGGLGKSPPDIAPDHLLSAAGAAGASLRVHRIHTLDQQLRNVALAFLDAFGEEININAYASGAGASGLARHTDPYDVFVLQTAGTKQWRLEGRDAQSPTPYREGYGGDQGTLLLEPGDLLFVPAGIRHRAEVVRGPSLHLALSLQTKSHHSLVEWLAARLHESLSPRRWVPRHANDATTYDPAMAELTEAALAELGVDARQRWLTYREGIEYERTVASFENYRTESARRFR